VTDLERRAPVSRVATWLGVSPRTVRNLIHAGSLEAVDLHGGNPAFRRPLWSVSVASVRRFLDGCAPKHGNDDRAPVASDAGPTGDSAA